MMIDLNKEMAWVTFMEKGWQTIWHPITDVSGNQLEWSDSNKIMNHCRTQFNTKGSWVSFGIAPTSQMILENAVRDNL